MSTNKLAIILGTGAAALAIGVLGAPKSANAATFNPQTHAQLQPFLSFGWNNHHNSDRDRDDRHWRRHDRDDNWRGRDRDDYRGGDRDDRWGRDRDDHRDWDRDRRGDRDDHRDWNRGGDRDDHRDWDRR